MREKDFRSYIERVEQLKSEKNVELNDTDLKEIAQDVGITESDLEEARKKSSDSLTRAKEYLERQLLDDALKEALDSASLAPWDKAPLYVQALIYEQKANKGDKESSAMAMELCRRIIKMDAMYEPAFDLLARLENPPFLRVAGKYLAGAAIGFGALIYLSFSPAPAGNSPHIVEPAATKNPQIPVTHPESTPKVPLESQLPSMESTVNNDALPLVDNRPAQLPVVLVSDKNCTGIKLSSYTSVLRFGFHQISCNFINESNLEYTLLKLKLEYVDSKGTLIDDSNDIAFLDTHEGLVRPGDSFGRGGTYSLKSLKLCPSMVRLVPIDYKSMKSPGDYGKSPQLKISWETPQQERFQLTASLRNSTLKESMFTSKGTYQAFNEIAFKNTGTASYRLLVYKIRYRGTEEADELLSTKRYVTMSSWEPFPPGETRIETAYDNLNWQVKDREVVIVEVK